MTDKPINTYSKAYVIERIEARKTSLTATITRADAAMATWWAQQDESMNAAHNKRLAEVERIQQQASAMERAWTAATTPQEKFEALKKVGSGGFSYLPNIPTPNGGKYQDKNSIPALLLAKDEAEKELAILDHTLAYFRETPVEEFTLTALQKLGLLNAVKFSIPS